MNGQSVRHSFWIDTYANDSKIYTDDELDLSSNPIHRYYEIYSYDGYNGDFVEVWDTDIRKPLKVCYADFQLVGKARRDAARNNNCELLGLKSVLLPFDFYVRWMN